jgi:lysophospholipase L1-like esterase
VANEYGVPVAGLLKAFSGPDLSLAMPREFIRDDVHPSDEGSAAIADVLADLGYEPVAPKK